MNKKPDSDRQGDIDIEVQTHKEASDKAFNDAKKATALVNKIMSEDRFHLTLLLTVGDKRKKI